MLDSILNFIGNLPGIRQINALFTKMAQLKVVSFAHFLFSLLFLLICGYVLFFLSGTIMIQSIIQGWWNPSAGSDFDTFMIAYLFGFPSLLGFIGSLLIILSDPDSGVHYKVLLVLPSVVWSLLLVLDIFRRPTADWIHLGYLAPVFLLTVLVTLFTGKHVPMPWARD